MKKPIPFGKYYLLERINVGGMAEVFRAKAYGVEGFERLLAVKRILPNIAEDAEFISMFIDEAKIAVQLNHANIAQTFDLGVVDGSYFIAMEHILGRDLRAIFERCRAKGEPMPISQAAFVVMKMCEGLDYAHNKRDPQGREIALVHRDVSPQNILVSFEGEVKLIDFGIAKAANKVSKTQAGILKGKFGYMSPEQVRGLPIDRRSDVFSTGIVLYELLTNERLFLGESDFSTLEKVRNVEILPPTTYNRKIPEELERIVLKALAKDVEDRYQNAIDLHDELQAFVYTAGEFYSRKDLASWMKKIFSKEMQEEAAKTEEYNSLEAPPAEADARPPTVGARPGSPPRKVTQAMPTTAPPPNGRPARASGGQAAVPPPPPPKGAPKAAKAGHAAADRTNELEWDEEEIETQIYDQVPEGDDAAAGGAHAAGAKAPGAGGPKSGEAPMPLAAKPAGANGAGAGRKSGGMATPAPSLSGSAAVQTPPPSLPPFGATPPPVALGGSSAIGSSQPAGPAALSPFGSSSLAEPPDLVALATGQGSGQRAAPSFSGSVSAPAFAGSVAASTPPSMSASMAGAGLSSGPPSSLGRLPSADQRGQKTIFLIMGGVTLGLLVIVGTVMLFSGGDKKPVATTSAAGSKAAEGGTNAATAETPATATPAGQGAQTFDIDPNTGFDVTTDPVGAKVLLDKKPIGSAPLRVRKLQAGQHEITVEPPVGFKGKTQTIDVAKGKSQLVHMRLDAMMVAGSFTSEPPGARITLITDGQRQTLGPAPLNKTLDPRKRYEVVFERPGYVTTTKPVEFGPGPNLVVAAVLAKAEVETAAPAPTPPAPRPVVKQAAPVVPAPAPTPPRKAPPAEPAEAAGPGSLAIGAKPQCKILVDGKDTGLFTPQRNLEVKAGTRKITFVNDEFGIKESFSVDVKAGETTKLIKDFTDRLPQ